MPATVEAAAEDVLQRAKRNVSAAGEKLYLVGTSLDVVCLADAKEAVTDNCKKLSADRGIKNPKVRHCSNALHLLIQRLIWLQLLAAIDTTENSEPSQPEASEHAQGHPTTMNSFHLSYN